MPESIAPSRVDPVLREVGGSGVVGRLRGPMYARRQHLCHYSKICYLVYQSHHTIMQSENFQLSFLLFIIKFVMSGGDAEVSWVITKLAFADRVGGGLPRLDTSRPDPDLPLGDLRPIYSQEDA